MNLFKVLVLSWLVGAGVTLVKDVAMPYEVKCTLMSLTYMLTALFCYRYVENDLRSNNVLGFYLSGVLCCCMVVSCWFNFIFISKDIYSALVDIRYYNAFSWRNIYKSVELLALFIVGRDVLICLYYRFICRCMRINVIIEDNKHHDSGR